jgi:hypothetical protein
MANVSRQSLDGGPSAPVGPLEPFPMGLAVDAQNAYAWNSGSFSGTTTLNNGDGTVVEIPLDGGAPLTLASKIEVAYAAPYVNAIAVDGHSVYWVAGAAGNDGAIMASPIGSAAPVALYSGQPFPEALVTDGTNVYWTNWGTFDSHGAYNNDGTLMQGLVDGGGSKVLASGLSAPGALAVDAQNVYWTNVGRLGGGNLPAPNTGSVMQVPIGGGTITTLASTQAVPLGIAVAGGTVYWCEYVLSAPGLILSAPVGGGTVTPLVSGLSDPFGLTISGDTLYWSDSPPTSANSGKILALSPR